jgi:8-oxo-dGTP pyrophosphatase MutT (NUDIX family)
MHLGEPVATEKVKTSVAAQIIVAGVLEHEKRFLLIEERVDGVLCLNQPAGHLDPGEAPEAGAVRETLEESGVLFDPTHLIGVYEWYSTKHEKLFIRFAYTGKILDFGDGFPLDANIVRVKWMTPEQAMADSVRLRSPFVISCIQDYLRGVRYPVSLVKHFIPG